MYWQYDNGNSVNLISDENLDHLPLNDFLEDISSSDNNSITDYLNCDDDDTISLPSLSTDASCYSSSEDEPMMPQYIVKVLPKYKDPSTEDFWLRWDGLNHPACRPTFLASCQQP